MSSPDLSPAIKGLAFVALGLAHLAFVSCGGGRDGLSGRSPETASSEKIAVSNSWLECCVRDLAGADCEIIRICPPGSCPGHFDVRPGAVSDLRDCRLLFLFDFQQSMSERLRAVSKDRLDLISVAAPGGLCVPSTYLAGCEAIHAVLVEAYPEAHAALDTAMDSVRERMGALEDEVLERIQAAGLSGAPVVTSGHQEGFCRWLGLEPVGTYSGSETASPAQIDALLEKGSSSGARGVVANLQEGAQAGEALSHQLGAPLIVFSNFPSMSGGEMSFDALVRSNVNRLLEAI
jgi:zinc transport system substrate-binding protein